MNSIKPKKIGSNSRLLGALRSFLAMLTGVLALFGLQAYAASTTVSVNFGSTLSSMPAYGLGVGCSVYDYGMTASGSAPAVANSGATAIRYPGGSFADIYHWQTGTACNGGYVAPGTDFDTFMNNLVNPAGAKAIITCNYGSDPTCSTGASPSEAAAWVQYANVTKGYGIKYWEIGNEQAGNGYYGSSFQWEEDLHSDKSPMAYGQNAAAFSSAMKAYDPTIKIGVGVIKPGAWPDTDASHPYNKCVLTNCASAVDFVILHWYPDGPAAQSLQSPTQIPGVASSMRSEINSYVGARASSVEILITETGPYTNTGPAAALFTSDTYLAWIENGIQNVDFQELHQGFLAEGISGVADHAPIWGAYGCRMARNLASVGDTFVTASSGTTMVGVHAVKKTNGHYGVMLINRDPTNSYTITVNASGATLASSGTRYDFGAANFGSSIYPSSGPTQSTITGIGSSSFSITVPAYTMSVVDIPAANVPPVAPANLVATPSSGAVQLSWNGSAGADSYLVKRSTTSGSGYTNIATGVTATSFTDTGLVNGTTYYYVVAATNVYGLSPDSTEASATPGLVANLIVNTVGTLNGNGQTFLEATGNSLNEATLAANIATAFANNAGGVWNFDGTYFNVTSGQTIALTYGTSQANSLILTLTEGAGANGINQSSVGTGEATSGSTTLGLAGNGATRTFTPNKPLLTVAIFNTDRNDATRIPVLTVTYQDNTTASTSGANANNVYFHCLSGTESNPIVSFAISQNNYIRYDDLAFIVAKPPAPQNLTATMGDANVALAWSAAPNATAYYVKRSNTSSNFTTIATNLTVTFTNTGLSNGTLYYYVVSALNGAGESANSTPVSARPTSFAPDATRLQPAPAISLQLNWPADHTGWQLQSQTNSLAIGLGTNWVTVPDSTETNQFNVTVDPSVGTKFFRLVKP